MAGTGQAPVTPEGTRLQLMHRNADVMRRATEAIRKERGVEATEIGTGEVPDDDPHPDGEREPEVRSEIDERREDAQPTESLDGGAPEPHEAPVEGESESEPKRTREEAPTADEYIDVKVDGKTERVLKADVEDAGGVRAYQKDRAASRRLDDAAKLARDAEDLNNALRRRAHAMGLDPDTLEPIKGSPAPAGTPAGGGAAGAAPLTGAAPAADPKAEAELEDALEQHSQAVTLAQDADEIKKAGRRLIKAAMATAPGPAIDRQAINRMVADREEEHRSNRDMAEFQTEHADVATDAECWAFARALGRQAMEEDIVRLGARPEAVRQLTDAQLGNTHALARADGAARSLKTIFNAAAERVRTRFNMTKPAASGEAGAREPPRPTGQGSPAPRSTPRPTAAALERRQAIKGGAAVATSTPASSATAPSRESRIPSNSEYIAAMRARRGLPPEQL
jgi:hypothetical protein